MTTRYLAYSGLYGIVLAAILFGAAGDIRWPEAWIFLFEFVIASGATVAWLARHDPALLRERFAIQIHRDQALWDRLFYIGMMTASLGWLVLMAVDARRYGFSHISIVLEACGALAFAASVYVTWQTFKVNTFAVPQARIQASRKQKVVSEGPYRFVRHPMYFGAILYFIGMPLLLGSWLGLLAAVPLTIALAVRSIGEERMLRRDLEGYEAYVSTVRWRIVPRIW